MLYDGAISLAFIVIGILNYAAVFLVFITIQKVSSFVYRTYRTSTVVSTDLSFVNRFISFFFEGLSDTNDDIALSVACRDGRGGLDRGKKTNTRSKLAQRLCDAMRILCEEKLACVKMSMCKNKTVRKKRKNKQMK